MIGHLFNVLLYAPIYNLLIFLVDKLPGGDLGLAVIIVTVIVKLAIMPLNISALRTSRAMQAIQPEFKRVQEQYKDDKEAQAKETFALYKKYDLHPFASMLATFIQLPIIIALYIVFRHESAGIDPTILYPFVHVPPVISTLFLGFFTLTAHNIILSVIAAAAQFVQAYYAMPIPAMKEGASASEQFNRSMAINMRFMLPILIGVVAYASSGAIALYFITTSIITVGQELLIRRLPMRAIIQKTA
jgi:YidC/Oxa1 family membrane protein insertase